MIDICGPKKGRFPEVKLSEYTMIIDYHNICNVYLHNK